MRSDGAREQIATIYLSESQVASLIVILGIYRESHGPKASVILIEAVLRDALEQVRK